MSYNRIVKYLSLIAAAAAINSTVFGGLWYVTTMVIAPVEQNAARHEAEQIHQRDELARLESEQIRQSVELSGQETSVHSQGNRTNPPGNRTSAPRKRIVQPRICIGGPENRTRQPRRQGRQTVCGFQQAFQRTGWQAGRNLPSPPGMGPSRGRDRPDAESRSSLKLIATSTPRSHSSSVRAAETV